MPLLAVKIPLKYILNSWRKQIGFAIVEHRIFDAYFRQIMAVKWLVRGPKSRARDKKLIINPI